MLVKTLKKSIENLPDNANILFEDSKGVIRDARNIYAMN